MRRLGKGLMIWGAGLLVFAAGCEEQAKTPSEPQEAEAAVVKGEDHGTPEIKFESVEYDFGLMRPGQQGVGKFAFKNTGDGTLVITRLDTCCGIKLTLEKTEYAPGETGQIVVKYTATRRKATVRKTLYCNTNDALSRKLALKIKANIVPVVVFEPTLMRLSLVEQNAGCSAITLESTDGRKFSVTSFESTGDSIAADVDSSVKAEKFVIEPKADASKLLENLKGFISIGVAYPEPDKVVVAYDVLPRFSVKPAMIVAFYSQSREPFAKHLWVISNYGEEFEIESAFSREGRFEVAGIKENSGGNGYVITLKVKPPEGDVQRFNDMLYVNLKNDVRLEVPCQGVYSEKNAAVP